MPNFLDIETQYRNYAKAKFVVVPVPYEATTSYGKGTKNGPAAILKASQYLETFDEELKSEPYTKGIHTLKPINVRSLESEVRSFLKDSKVPVILGGEHSITPHAVKACKEQHKNLSVLQFDAHADLRDKYLPAGRHGQGRKDSHACVMRRVLDICPAVQVGIRSISKAEWDFADKSGQLKKIHWAEKVELVEKIETQLSEDVYISFDVDVFDPSVLPATGTPEPGGMLWYEVLDILKGVCATKNVVGFDVVELAPRKGDNVSDFTAAKLVYKLIAFSSL